MAKFPYVQVSVGLLSLCLVGCGCNEGDGSDSSHNSQSLDKTALYSLGGSVSGLTNGKLLKLAANEETLSLNSNGKFNFLQALKAGSLYSISIQELPENMKCVIGKPSGTATANVSDISVSCYTPVPASGISSDQCYAQSSIKLVSCNDPTVKSLNAEQDGARSSINTMGFGALTQGTNTYSSSDCVKDKLTGLLWEIKTADGGLRDYQKTFTHFDSTTAAQKKVGTKATQAEIDATDNAATYVKEVNRLGLCGFTDWRLPTARELHSIVNYGLKDIAIDTTVFINPPRNDDEYWTSSSYQDNLGTDQALYVNFYAGYVFSNYRNETLYVRLVRGPILSETNRYTVAGDEVTDTQTGLVWQRCTHGQTWNGSSCSGAANELTFAQALAKSAELKAQGWRLPSIKELFSLVTYGPGNTQLDPLVFPQTFTGQLDFYLSSTPSITSAANAWVVNFGLLIASESKWSSSLYVRYVRDMK